VPFWGVTISSSFSPGHPVGEETFFVFFPLLLPLPPTCSVRAKTRRHPPHDDKTEKSCPASNASIGHLYRHRDRAGGMCAPCMGSDGTRQGRPCSPCPYKYCPKRKKEKEGKRKGDRERETDSFWERRERSKEGNNSFCERKGDERRETVGIFEREKEWREGTEMVGTRGKKNRKRETEGVFLEERRQEKSGDREGRNRTE